MGGGYTVGKRALTTGAYAWFVSNAASTWCRAFSSEESANVIADELNATWRRGYDACWVVRIKEEAMARR